MAHSHCQTLPGTNTHSAAGVKGLCLPAPHLWHTNSLAIVSVHCCCSWDVRHCLSTILRWDVWEMTLLLEVLVCVMYYPHSPLVECKDYEIEWCGMTKYLCSKGLISLIGLAYVVRLVSFTQLQQLSIFFFPHICDKSSLSVSLLCKNRPDFI